MPSVTREQVNKWNAKLQNGFRFDIQRYVVWGEKQIKKSIELADGMKNTIVRCLHFPLSIGTWS